MNRFMFNGKYSTDYGIYISGEGTYNSPELDVDVVSVPGRNGDLVFSNKRYKNITVEYPAFIRSEFADNAQSAKAWLLRPQKYCRLQDDYHPDEYRLALFEGPLNFDMQFLNHSGMCTVSFNCKPQRYLVSGEEQFNCTNGGSIYNPTLFDAEPLILVSGSGAGTLHIGEYTVQILSLSNLILDCETQNAYYGSTNLNSTISADIFPKLTAGNNVISWSGGIQSVKITPRWWTL